MPRAQSFVGFVGLLGTLIALLYQPVYQRLVVFGVFRPLSSFENIHGLETLKKIPDTGYCEDIHHHKLSNKLYTTCEDDGEQRFQWFPAMGCFKNSKSLKTGSITLVDPEKFTSQKLKLEGFQGPFVTHGIDIVSPEDEPQTVYIFAVNHLPNAFHYDAPSSESASPDKARSQIELFKHTIGSDEAVFLRSIRHPLIRTPNDIVATSTDTFYVTNDHYYREGHLRAIEDGLTQQLAAWTDTMYVKITEMKSKDPEAGIEVTTALTGMHNNNGLGRGHPDNPSELVLCDASGGVMHRAQRSLDSKAGPELKRLDSFQMDSCLDNPSYYVDEYATKTSNASGYLLPGLARAIDIGKWDQPGSAMPGLVWHLRQGTKPSNASIGGWTPHLIFQDDGRALNSATSAIIVGIDPKENKGKKQGWLFVTGFLSRAMIATKIDL